MEEVAISNRNQIFSLRLAEPRDGSAIAALKYALQIEEGNRHTLAPNAELWIERLFGSDRQFEALVAEHNSRIVGTLLFNLKYYTGWPEPAVYVQDLFVESAFRRRGIALPAGHFKFLRVWSVKFLHPARQDMMIVSLTLFPGQGLQRPL